MIRYFYKMDEHFKKAYEDSGEIPADGAWNDIAARLDELDAVLYKKKFKQRKTAALLLFCLLGTYGLYETAPLMKRKPVAGIVMNTTKEHPMRQELMVDPSRTTAPVIPFQRSALKRVRHQVPAGIAGYRKQRAPGLKLSVDHNGLKYAMIDAGSASLPVNLTMPQLKSDVFSARQSTSIGHPNCAPATPSTASKDPAVFRNEKRWSILTSVSIDHADYRIDDDLPRTDSKASIEGRETHNVSFSASLNARYTLSRRWSIQSGLRYSNTLIGIDPHEIYAEQTGSGQAAYKYVTSSGYAYINPVFGTNADSLETTSARHHLVFVSVPLLINYRIEKKKWIFRPTLGLQMNWLAKASVKTEIKEGFQTEAVSIHQLEGRKSFYISYVAEAGIEYQLNPQWTIDMTPSFQYGITSITKNNAVNTFPYSFGIGIGMMYHF